MADEWVEGHELGGTELQPQWVEGHELQPQAPPAGPTWQQAAARGVAQGMTGGFADESAGVGALAGALSQKYLHLPQAIGGEGWNGASNNAIHPLEAYKEARDAYRADDEAAKKAPGGVFAASEIGGALPTAFLTPFRAGKGASMLAQVGKGALSGGVFGLGQSEGKTAGEDALNALAGAGIGAGAGYVAGRLGGFGTKAAEGVRNAEADAAQKIAQLRQAAQRSATSSVGGETAAVLKNFENTRAVAENVGGIHPPEVVDAARAKLQDPKYLEVVKKAGKNAVDLGADRLHGSLATAENALETAASENTPSAIDAAQTESMKSPFRRQVLPRMMLYGERLLPAAIGHHVGGVPGLLGGAAMGLVMGKPGTSAANMAKNPAFRKMVFGGLGAASKPLAAIASKSAPASELVLGPDARAMLEGMMRGTEPQWVPAGDSQ